MYERVLNDIIQEGIDEAVAKPDILRYIFAAPGWEPAEVEKLVTFFLGEGKPDIIHNFARKGGTFPSFTIILQSERISASFMGDDAPAYDEFVAELEVDLSARFGRPVEIAVRRWQHTYTIGVFTENPDVTIAYYNLIRYWFSRSEERFLDAGFEEPTYSGMDLQPDPRYLPDTLFGRQFQITGDSLIFTADDFPLGPLGTGRGTTVRGIHISDQVEGVLALITPTGPGDDT